MTIYALVVGLSNEGWAYYHQYVNMWFYIISSFFIAVWLSIGGMRDLFSLLHDLKVAQRDHKDDGTVRDHDYELQEERQ